MSFVHMALCRAHQFSRGQDVVLLAHKSKATDALYVDPSSPLQGCRCASAICRVGGKLDIPTLYIFSGLPASGKSTLAKLLSHRTGAMYVRVDTIEQGLRDLCNFKVEGEGYRLSYRIIRDNLALGLSAISDSCNPIELTRNEWQEIAASIGAKLVNIEVRCSDATEHEYRVNTRENEIPNLNLPNWQQVQNHYYEPWGSDVIQIDTAGQSVEDSFAELLRKLGMIPIILNK